MDLVVFFFHLWLREGSIMATSHDNTITLTCSQITAIRYVYSSLVITSRQPSTVPPTISQSGNTWTITLKCGRSGSSEVADSFNETCGGSVHAYAPGGAGRSPKELNFYFQVIVETPYGSATIALAQGHLALTSNWWMGGNGVLNHPKLMPVVADDSIAPNYSAPMLAVVADGSIVQILSLSGSTSSFALTNLWSASAPGNYTSWMADSLSWLGRLPLTKMAIPASHDAGMATAQDCTAFASACNTQTQTLTIGEQLSAGCRYFDLRPVLYRGVLYTGHSKSGMGCNGQTLASILTDVRAYLERGRDLVILKFSHYYDRDSGGSWGDTQQVMLLQQVTGALGASLFVDEVPAPGGLSSLTLSTFIKDGPVVLAVFEELSPSLQSRFKGVYSYADKGGSGDLVVYDKFSNVNDITNMEADQLKKMTDPGNRGNNLFLLSWTLTQNKLQVAGCAKGNSPSILGIASAAKAALDEQMRGAFNTGMLTPATIPNLVYVDDFGPWATQTVLFINQTLNGRSS